jgi:ribosomal protein S18 acetylase RimI-like enzyme
MDPMRDLGGVADLIEEAFANDLDRSGQNALQELRWLSRLKPILWWMIYTNPEHSDFLSGFVWEEHGKIIGNITVNRTGAGSRRWMISNLAVAQEYRGRGIARGLMYAGLELAKEYNSTAVSLQVRADNEPAKKLYDTLQFKEVSGTAYLWAGQVPKVKDVPLPNGVRLRLRNFTTQDARDAYNLACAATPLTVQKEWPLRRRQFRLKGSERINNMFCWMTGGGVSTFWVVEDGRRFVGLVNIRPGGWGQTHKLELIVHPDWWGYLEKALISQALMYLYKWQNRSISIKHPTYHSEAIEVFKEFGLKETQTLTWMKLEL